MVTKLKLTFRAIGLGPWAPGPGPHALGPRPQALGSGTRCPGPQGPQAPGPGPSDPGLGNALKRVGGGGVPLTLLRDRFYESLCVYIYIYMYIWQFLICMVERKYVMGSCLDCYIWRFLVCFCKQQTKESTKPK